MPAGHAANAGTLASASAVFQDKRCTLRLAFCRCFFVEGFVFLSTAAKRRIYTHHAVSSASSFTL